MVGGEGVVVTSREFELEANCWRRCSKAFMLLKITNVN